MLFMVSIAVCLALAFGPPLVFLTEAKPVSANGATRAVVQNARAGPYQLQVGILPGNPKVGSLHLSILVQDAEEGTAITDATVVVMATGPTGAANVGPVPAVNTPQNPQFYEVDIPLDTVGSWTLTLETNSRLGEARLDVSLEVTEADGFNLVWPAAGAVVVLALAFWTWNRSRRRRRIQQS